VHGEEIEGVWLIDELSKHFNKQYPYQSFGVLLLLNANPDGISNLQRTNANQIDLNRNLPTKDWSAEFTNPRYNPGKAPGSEPENKALLQLINSIQPLAILSLHSFSKVQVNLNGTQHGSAVRDWGQKMAEDCGYPLTEDIGYPTPGCLGTYAGSERGIPMITLEIERGMSEENVRKKFVPTVLKGLNYWEK
jgi:protein MpaA